MVLVEGVMRYVHSTAEQCQPDWIELREEFDQIDPGCTSKKEE
jgi:hypothetical protein